MNTKECPRTVLSLRGGKVEPLYQFVLVVVDVLKLNLKFVRPRGQARRRYTHARSARRKKLVREGLSHEDRVGVQVEAFTEPVAALVTLPFAFVGELAWNLAWLSLIPLGALLRRRARKVV